MIALSCLLIGLGLGSWYAKVAYIKREFVLIEGDRKSNAASMVVEPAREEPVQISQWAPGNSPRERAASNRKKMMENR
jgi:hypothetical protein